MSPLLSDWVAISVNNYVKKKPQCCKNKCGSLENGWGDKMEKLKVVVYK